MSRKILIIAILVIVLVSINWFQSLVAQDLSQLSDEEKQALIDKYRKSAPKQDPNKSYKSADLYGDKEDPLAAHRMQRSASDVEPQPDQMLEEQKESFPDLEPGPTCFSELTPFGREFFERASEIDPPVDIASASDYVLGPGDNVVVYLWGRVEKEYNLTVDREGKLFVPTVGAIPAWGLTLDQFLDRAKKHFGKVYTDFDITCSLGRVRSVRIYVTGEVERPGAYTVSALTSLFNALYIGGGPTDRGSMRQVRLMRRGKPVAEVDLYKLLLQGDNSTDIRLESGDVVFVPVVGPRAAIRGEIKRCAVYELTGNEKVKDLLQLAGNTTSEAYLERVQLERISGRNEWEVIDLNLAANGSDSLENIQILDGDRITIHSLFDAKSNMVGLFGQVQHPGYYERTDTTRVSDILAQAKLHPYNVFLERADLFRYHSDWQVEVISLNLEEIQAGDSLADILLHDRDSLHIYAMDEVNWEQKVYVEGAVRKPGWYRLYDGMSAADLIFLAGSFTRSADTTQAELASLDERGEVSLRYIPLNKAFASQVHLERDDHLFVRQIPEWKENREVFLTGEVYYPGSYVMAGPNETLYQLLQRAGGFTPSAFPKGLVLDRYTIEADIRRMKIEEILVRSQPIVHDSLGNVKHQNGLYFEPDQLNRIIVDTDRLLASNGREGDVVLQPRDRIYVPAIPSGVSVIGSVGSNGTLKFTEGKNVKHYLKSAGNLTRQADKKAIRLIQANGIVETGKKVLKRKVQLGDVIVVPNKIQRERDWGKFVSTTLAMVTSVLTSAYIVSNL